MTGLLDRDRVLSSARKRFLRRQWARRWLVARWPVMIALVVLAAGTFVWGVYFSSLFDVRQVTVQGEHILTRAQIVSAAGVEMDVPLARVDLAAITKRVEALPAVRSAEVSRSWPHAVQITVVERSAVAAVRTRGAIWALDSTGVLFSRIAGVPKGLPEIHAGPQADRDTLREGASLVAALPRRLAQRVSFVDVRSVDNITLHLTDGALVQWGSASDTAAKARVLSLLMRQSASVYDVSSPGQPTIKP